MSFSLTSFDIQLKEGAILEARCEASDGTLQWSQLNLNDYIANDYGQFYVVSQNFLASARNVRLEDNHILQAELDGADGNWYPDSIDLDSFITNDEGRLAIVDSYVPMIYLRPQHFTWPPEPPESDLQCELCRDWPRDDRSAHLKTTFTLEDLELNPERSAGCPTCTLLERIAHKYANNNETVELGIFTNYNPDSECGSTRVRVRVWPEDESVLDPTEHEWILHRGPDHSENNSSAYYSYVPVLPLLTGDSTDPASVSFAKQCLESCIMEHPQCPKSTTASLPARILDIGTAPSDVVRLKTTSNEEGQYACLSHCWGPTPTLLLTRSNIGSFHHGIPWSSLQSVYTDAITFCRLLGIRYLWIDSLCVIQDSASDWERESAEMHSYYGNSIVCIAATSAATHDNRCRSRSYTMVHEGIDTHGAPYHIFARPVVPHITDTGYSEQLQIFPLLQRAWVYQERRMSPRILHITDMEIFFECNNMVSCECGGSDKPEVNSRGVWTKARESYFTSHRSITKSQDLNFQIQFEWRSFVYAYSHLNLTRLSDRLPALSGLAQMARQRRGAHHVPTGRYLAGCWEGSIISDMAWAIGPDLRRDVEPGWFFEPPQKLPPFPHSRAMSPKPVEYIAPSWSWASTTERVDYPPFAHPDHLCELLDAHVDLAGPDQHGAVRGGFLSLKVQLLPSAWEELRWSYACLSDIAVSNEAYDGMMWWRDWVDGQGHNLDDGVTLYLMPLSARRVPSQSHEQLDAVETVYLVLRAIDKHVSPPVYERVGWTCWSGDGGPDISKVQQTVIKLI